MSNKSLFSLAFIIGAATGSVATWYLLKDKYEALAQEEIDSVKEVFLRREQELKDQSVKKTVGDKVEIWFQNGKNSICIRQKNH